MPNKSVIMKACFAASMEIFQAAVKDVAPELLPKATIFFVAGVGTWAKAVQMGIKVGMTAEEIKAECEAYLRGLEKESIKALERITAEEESDQDSDMDAGQLFKDLMEGTT